ncbi:hypothetical protein [Micromonospora echinospora]|uniref:hypothetical protein n=1 Tax=Micromonospora echinospora TaxID=1877 RepID=UPI003A87F7A9
MLSVAQASRHFSRKAIRHRLATGRWRRVHRGVLVTHNGPLDDGPLRWIAVLATGSRAVLGGATAAQQWGLRRYGSRAVHLLLSAGLRADRPPPGVVVHRTRHLPEEDILPVGQPPRPCPPVRWWTPPDGRAPTRRRRRSSPPRSSNVSSAGTICTGFWTGCPGPADAD